MQVEFCLFQESIVNQQSQKKKKKKKRELCLSQFLLFFHTKNFYTCFHPDLLLLYYPLLSPPTIIPPLSLTQQWTKELHETRRLTATIRIATNFSILLILVFALFFLPFFFTFHSSNLLEFITLNVFSLWNLHIFSSLIVFPASFNRLKLLFMLQMVIVRY